MKRLVSGVLVCLAVMMAVSTAAHPALVRSHPSAGETLKTPPTVLQLWFSETPSAAVSLITLTGPGGSRGPGADVKLGKTVVNKDKSISADVLTTLPPGEYLLSYRTAADDGHMLRDSFTFFVAAK